MSVAFRAFGTTAVVVTAEPAALDAAVAAVTAEVAGVDGRTITFRVEARDPLEVIGGGTHQRVIVSVARFDERVQRKLRGRTVSSGGR